MSLSNRTLWVLILLWFILSIYWFYMYFFVYNLTSLTINSNTENYKVELKNLKNNFKKECEKKKCELHKIPPFEYDLIISKDWYKKITKKISIKRNNILNINLEKEIIFKENISNKKEIKAIKKTRTQVLEELKNRKNNYKILDLWNNKKIFVRNNWVKLEFFIDKEKLFDYKIISENSINFKKIYWNKNYLFFELDEKNYLFNIFSKDLIFIDLKPNIKYVKNYSNDHEFDFITDLWVYIFDITSKKIRFFSKFDDFVYISPVYIWLVDFKDLVKKRNLWFENKSWNLIISYNQKTKKKNLLKEVSFEIEKILKEGTNIIIKWKSGEEYVLQNY